MFFLPYEGFTEGVFEGTVRRVGHQHANAVSVERGIEVVLAIALNGLDGPGSVLAAAP